MLRDRGATTDIFQITFFGLRHRVQLKADGKTPSRHFFW
jgi:hypothetical protein